MRYLIITICFLCLSITQSTAQSQSNIILLGSLDYEVEGNDVWGYVDSNNTEYAIVGLTNGVSFVNLSNPVFPSETFFISGQNTIWRDIKVWDHYAFVTSDNTTEGLLIIDLDDLTGNTYTYTTLDNNGDFMFSKGHNIFIDEFGKAYIFGGNVSGSSATAGALILDVTTTDLTEGNEVLPTILGIFDDFYFHDGMVRGDTLWGSAVYEGKFYAIDVSQPASPEIFNNGLAFHETQSEFTHNCWVSDDGNTLFTTDEVSGGYIGAYDVSDLSNIQELDYIQSSPENGNVIPHNTHVLGNFLVTSYYRDGVVVHDATYPDHLIEVGHYDNYAGSGNGFDGSWGTYPFLPSGLILSSEINSSSSENAQLLVLLPNYNQACYISGIVSNYITNQPILASVEILNSDQGANNTNLSGEYFDYTLDPNTYEVVFSANDYISDTLSVEMQNGEMQTINVQLISNSAVFGCTDISACNYNEIADVNNGSCLYIDDVCETCEDGIIVDNDTDNDGVCDQDEIAGCLEPEACNYNSNATDANDSCEYVDDLCDTCVNGVVIDNDWDGDSICNEDELEGCLETSACNYNPNATDEDDSCEYIDEICESCENGIVTDNDLDDDGICDQDEIAGCLDENACNYNPFATDDDSNSCIFLDGICETCLNGIIIDNDSDDNGICDEDELSFNCVENECVDPLNGTGTYTSLNNCQEACHTSYIDENEDEILVFPNPFNSHTVIKFTNPNSEYSLLMINDIQGKTIRTYPIIKTDVISIKKEGLSSGIYYLQIQGDKKRIQKQIMVY